MSGEWIGDKGGEHNPTSLAEARILKDMHPLMLFHRCIILLARLAPNGLSSVILPAAPNKAIKSRAVPSSVQTELRACTPVRPCLERERRTWMKYF